MFEISIENVRCFVQKTTIPIRPLTIVIGENSSGKSTLLAITAAIGRGTSFPQKVDFNISPFELGGYENITSQVPGSSSNFSIGFSSTENNKINVSAKYSVVKGQSQMDELRASSPKGKLEYVVSDGRVTGSFEGAQEELDNQKKIPFSIEIESEDDRIRFEQDLFFFMAFKLSKTSANDRFLPSIHEFLYDMTYRRPSVVAIAPIRSKPERTYDEFKSDYNAEGEHVPYLINTLTAKRHPNKRDQQILKAINQFGKRSGLFRRLSSKKFGKLTSDPFKLLVDVGSVVTNLKDVGYGVSQVIPVVIESLVENNKLMLLQQPEVHLHPRAQAELGTFFASLASQADLQFVIETHSDYLVDRVRQEIANGTIKCEDVALIYCNKEGRKATAQRINIDRRGDILNPPQSYRDFFIREELNTLNRD